MTDPTQDQPAGTWGDLGDDALGRRLTFTWPPSAAEATTATVTGIGRTTDADTHTPRLILDLGDGQPIEYQLPPQTAVTVLDDDPASDPTTPEQQP